MKKLNVKKILIYLFKTASYSSRAISEDSILLFFVKLMQIYCQKEQELAENFYSVSMVPERKILLPPLINSEFEISSNPTNPFV
jgi:hypothetical protein